MIVDPEEVTIIPGFNSRKFESGSVAGLANEMLRTGGNEIPIRLRRNNGQLILTWGERRLKAALHIKQNKLDTEIEGGIKLRAEIVEYEASGESKAKAELSPGEGGDQQAVEKDVECQAFMDNLLENTRENLSDVDKSHVIMRLVGYGTPKGEIARRLGIAASMVSYYEPIVKLPVKLQRAMHDGKISTHAGIAILDLPDEQQDDAAQELLDELKSGKRVTRAAAANKVKKRKGEKEALKKPGLKVVRAFWETAALPAGEEEDEKEKSTLRQLAGIMVKFHDGKLAEKTAIKKVVELLG